MVTLVLLWWYSSHSFSTLIIPLRCSKISRDYKHRIIRRKLRYYPGYCNIQVIGDIIGFYNVVMLLILHKVDDNQISFRHSIIAITSQPQHHAILSNPFFIHSHHQQDMAGTPFLLAMVLSYTTILYSDLKFSLNDPIINQNLLSYLNDRQDLVDYLSSHSSNSADTTIGSSSGEMWDTW